MAEPASSAVGGIAVAAGAITLTGSIFGIQYDALLAGFFGGLVALSYLPPLSISRIASSVAASSVCAGFLGPIVALSVVHYLPWMSQIGDFMRMSSAWLIGLCAQGVLPEVPRLAKVLTAGLVNKLRVLLGVGGPQ